MNPQTDPINISFTLNGKEISAAVKPDLTLLRFLRDQLGMIGTKDSCTEEEHAGACTVIINGKAQASCSYAMKNLQGASVETIEGLAQSGKLHPIQEAFIEKGAVQCGFCIPGMIMTTKALLAHNPHPTRAEIQQAFTESKNYCRCTGYVKIFEAVELAAARLAGAAAPAAAERPANPVLPGVARKMVCGAQEYGDDLQMEGMLHGKILWAAHAHARILSMDVSAAAALPGVATVVTARDIPGRNAIGLIIQDQPAIIDDYVRFIGDPLAAVFAETREIAEEAVRLIRVEYEVLPGIFSPEEAARPDAPKLHPRGNLLHRSSILRGDAAAAFAKCDAIVEGSYSTPFIEHGFIETETGIAYVDADGDLVIKMGSQCAFEDRKQVAAMLNLPEEKVRIVSIIPGGAFGGKEDMILQQFLALGAIKTGRPVKMMLARSESLRAHVKRHPAKLHYKTGATKDGRVQAIEARIVMDTGAYASLGIDVMENAVVFSAGPYFVPNLDVEGEVWYTNNVPAGAMRGFGVNQVAIALEQQFDELARQLHIDPFEFRRINALDVGLPTASDHVLEEGIAAIKPTIEAAREVFKNTQVPATHGSKRIGVGVASAVKNIGYGHNVPESAGAIAELDAAGKLVIRHSQHEYGQGAQMGLVKLASMELGTAMDDITVVGPDTAITPPTGPTTASRQTFLTGNAVVMACQALKDQLFGHAAERLGSDPRHLRLEGAFIISPETGGKLPISELGERFVVERRYHAPHSDEMLSYGERSRYGTPEFKSKVTHFCYAYSTQVAIVEVDVETGEVKVLKLISSNDVGKILNREAIEGQIQGGVMMGVGYALSEEFVVKDGINQTHTLAGAGVPAADQTPEIVPVIVEVAHPFGPQGVKGFAEAPSLAVAPAILNAIYDAVQIRIHDIPAKPEVVRRALQGAKA